MSEGAQDPRPLRMVAQADRLQFITPLAASEVAVSDLIERGDVAGLMLWAVWAQLRDNNTQMREMNKSLAAIATAATDPKAVERLQAQANGAIQQVIGQLEELGIKLPPAAKEFAQATVRSMGG